jgi:hypothetical protein
VCFYNYSPHPKPPVFGSSNVCVLHDLATKYFFICTEMRMIVVLIELPNREHVFFYASLDHTDLILFQNFRHAHVH